MPRLLVVFYSRTGNTARLADAIADGAERIRFSEVDVRRLDDLAPEEIVNGIPSWRAAREELAGRYRTLESVEALADYDAIVFGSPTRYGVMAAELKHLLDQTGPLRDRGAFVNKVGSAFTSMWTQPGGPETTLWSIMTPLANLGMIIVPPPMTSGDGVDLEDARSQGERVARVTGWVTHGLGHEADAHGHGHAHGHAHDHPHGHHHH